MRVIFSREETAGHTEFDKRGPAFCWPARVSFIVERWAIQLQNIWIAYYCWICSSHNNTKSSISIPKDIHNCNIYKCTYSKWYIQIRSSEVPNADLYYCLLLLSSGTVNAGLEKVLRQAEFIADIYRQFPHGCIFIINCEAPQHVE